MGMFEVRLVAEPFFSCPVLVDLCFWVVLELMIWNLGRLFLVEKLDVYFYSQQQKEAEVKCCGSSQGHCALGHRA